MKRGIIIVATGVLGAVLSVWILAWAIVNRDKNSNTISVTGMCSKDFSSDLIVWNGDFVRTSNDLKNAYSDIKRDRELIKEYLNSKNIDSNLAVFSAVTINKTYDDVYNQSGYRVGSKEKGYELRQNVKIESKEVDKIESVSREITELINSGVNFNSYPPEYYYTKLPELKLDMIAEASKDAYNRARQIADNGHSDIGNLRKSSMGVFQIIAKNSSEDYAWGGSFNITSRFKTATITIKMEYITE